MPILLSARNATKLGREVKTGVWTDDYMQFPVEEYAGDVTPYNDYQNGVTTDVNYEFPVREQLRFQTTLTFGDLEAEKASSAKIGLINAKQRASAEIIGMEATPKETVTHFAHNITKEANRLITLVNDIIKLWHHHLGRQDVKSAFNLC